MGFLRSFRRQMKRLQTASNRRRKAIIEPLEPRILLSDTLTFSASAGAAVDLTLRLDDATQELQLIDNAGQSVLQSQMLDETDAVVITGSEYSDKLTIDFETPFAVPNGILFVDAFAGDDDVLTVTGQPNFWQISGIDQGHVDGVDFVGIENIAGGDDPDVVVLDDGAGMSGPIDGGGGEDILVGPAADTVWEISGSGSGSVNGVAFSGFENLQGAADNQDTFVFTGDGTLSGYIDGGAGGFDTLDIREGTYDTVAFIPTGPQSGSVVLDGRVITYLGLEPIYSTINAPTIDVLITTSADDNLTLSQDGSSNIVLDGATIETHILDLTGMTHLNIDLGDGTDTLTFSGTIDLGTVNLNISAESILADASVDVTTSADITLTAMATDDGHIDAFVDVDLGLDFLEDVLIADSVALIDLSSAAFAAGNMTLKAVSTLDLDTSGLEISDVSLAVIYAQSSASVLLDDTIIATDGFLDIDASSDVKTKATLAADAGSTSSDYDAAVAISVIESSAIALVGGASQLTVGGALTLSAANTTTALTTADGSTTGTAGAALAMPLTWTRPIPWPWPPQPATRPRLSPCPHPVGPRKTPREIPARKNNFPETMPGHPTAV